MIAQRIWGKWDAVGCAGKVRRVFKGVQPCQGPSGFTYASVRACRFGCGTACARRCAPFCTPLAQAHRRCYGMLYSSAAGSLYNRMEKRAGFPFMGACMLSLSLAASGRRSREQASNDRPYYLVFPSYTHTWEFDPVAIPQTAAHALHSLSCVPTSLLRTKLFARTFTP